MVRKSIYMALGLFFLIVMAFPLPECYVTRPDCPKRGSGPCPYSSSDAAKSCGAMSCPSQRLGPMSKPHADGFQTSSSKRPLYSRLVTHISVRGEDVGHLPAVRAAALAPDLPEPFLTHQFHAPVFIDERHPRAGPLIVLNQTFLI